MLGNNIILTPHPHGRRIEGVCYNGATTYPGIVVNIVPAVAPDAGGRLTWQPWSLSTDYPGLIVITDVDWQQGFTPQNPGYQTGRRMFLYVPLPGDELNMLLAQISGSTGDVAVTQGDGLITQTGSGRLVEGVTGTSGAQSPQFIAFETLTTALGQEWVHVMRK